MPLRARLLVSGLILAAGVAIFLAATVGSQASGRCPGQPAEIEAVTPDCGSAALNQDVIEVDLATGYEGELTINGIAVPTSGIRSLNLIRYRPAPGQPVEALPAQVNVVTVRFWKSSQSKDQSKTYQWTFRVL